MSAPGAARDLARLERLADLLDARFRVPFTGIRFGLDALLGLVPGIGDGLSLLPALYLVREAARLGAPRALLLRMVANVAMDAMVGSIPLAGDLFDVAFKANRRNLALLGRHLAAGGEAVPKLRPIR